MVKSFNSIYEIYNMLIWYNYTAATFGSGMGAISTVFNLPKVGNHVALPMIYTL